MIKVFKLVVVDLKLVLLVCLVVLMIFVKPKHTMNHTTHLLLEHVLQYENDHPAKRNQHSALIRYQPLVQETK